MCSFTKSCNSLDLLHHFVILLQTHFQFHRLSSKILSPISNKDWRKSASILWRSGILKAKKVCSQRFSIFVFLQWYWYTQHQTASLAYFFIHNGTKNGAKMPGFIYLRHSKVSTFDRLRWIMHWIYFGDGWKMNLCIHSFIHSFIDLL